MKVGARPYEGTKEVTHLLWYLATEEGLSLLEKQGPRGLNGLRVAPYYGCQLLRPSSVMGFEDPDKPAVAGAPDHGPRRRGRRLRGQVQVLRLPDHPGPRGGRAEGVARRPLAVARRRRRLHGHPLPALPPRDGRLPAQGRGGQRDRVQHAGAAPAAAHRPGARHRHARSWTSSATWSRLTACWRPSGPDSGSPERPSGRSGDLRPVPSERSLYDAPSAGSASRSRRPSTRSASPTTRSPCAATPRRGRRSSPPRASRPRCRCCVDGDVAVWDRRRILAYLAETYGARRGRRGRRYARDARSFMGGVCRVDDASCDPLRAARGAYHPP